jgi:hypothetical protein
MATAISTVGTADDASILETVRAFSAAGFGLHWLYPKQKNPIGIGWEKKAVATFDQLRKSYRQGNNLGVRLGEFSRVDGAYLHLIDLDIRKPDSAIDAWSALCRLFPQVRFETLPSVISGSGGESRHLYFVTDQPFASKKLAKSPAYEMVFDPTKGRKVEKKDWEIELFGGPKQAVMPPSIHPITGLPYRWERGFDLDGFDGVPHIPAAAVEAAGAIINDLEDDYVGNTERLGITIEEGEDILAALPLDPWCYNRGTYSQEAGWLKVGMALKHEFGDQGYDLWCEFSKQSSKYEENEQRIAWKSFKGKSRRPFRMISLKSAARDQQMINDMPDLPDLIGGIEECTPNASNDNDFDALLYQCSPEDDSVFTTGDEEESPAAAVARMNRKHAVISHGGKTLITTEKQSGEVTFATYNDFKLLYENDRRLKPGSKGGDDPNRYESVAAFWMRHPARQMYENGIVFAPGGTPEGALNLWRGWAVTPDAKGSCDLFLDHVRQVVCRGNVDHAAYVFGWMAHLVQKPDEKPGVALILRGLKGTGKDTIGEYLAAMIGRRHVPTVSDPRHITGNFNRHLESALLLHVQEGIWAGSHQAESQLKYLVTSETVQIERKGIDSISLDSFMRILITSNADWTVPASFDERRWAVFDVSDKHADDHVYFAPLRAEREAGGPAALLAWLQSYDLVNFNVRAAPQTNALVGQKLASLRGMEKWWYELLGAGELDCRSGYGDEWTTKGVTVLRTALRGEYASWIKERKFEGEPIAERAFGQLLRKMSPGVATKRGTQNSTRPYEYVLPDLEQCRREMEHYIRGPIDWTE